jgi:hypothetical protein
MFADVPLGKRVHSYIERSGLGMVLDVASAALSMLTVFTYMWETRYSEFDATWLALRAVDLVCSVLFAAEWCFWLWLSRNRPRFILSWQSLVDVVTIVPIFLSLFITRQVRPHHLRRLAHTLQSGCPLIALCHWPPSASGPGLRSLRGPGPHLPRGARVPGLPVRDQLNTTGWGQAVAAPRATRCLALLTRPPPPFPYTGWASASSLRSSRGC